jgi:7-carboxy-7-deazaguanine synthase
MHSNQRGGETVANLQVNEIFGPTIQGEGPSTGRHATFVRLSNCNQTCTWCDTPQTWVYTEAKAKRHVDGKVYSKDAEVHEMTPNAVIDRIKELQQAAGMPHGLTGHIVISGGEPMLQGPGVIGLIEQMQLRSTYLVPFEIETAGTIMPPSRLLDFGVQWNVSPKLQHSGNSKRVRYRPNVLSTLAYQRVAFKFVVQRVDDFVEIDEIVSECALPPNAIWIMPEGITTDQLVTTALDILPATLSRGWNLTYRLHNLLWGNERGH